MPSEENLDIVARYRMPVLGRAARRTPARAATEPVEFAGRLRRIPEGAMRPIACEGLGHSRSYLAFEGRAWIALHPRNPGSIIRWSRPADLDEARAIFSRMGYEMTAHGLQPSPFSTFALGMNPLSVAEGFPGGAEALREPVARRLADMLARDFVHDGRHVYLAARPPAIVLRRGREGGWTYRSGPATPFDPKNDEITFCVRQAGRFAKGLKSLDKALAAHVARDARRLARGFADLPADDSDLAELANAASVGALWLKGRLRRVPDPAGAVGEDFAGRLAKVRRNAALGMFGAIPEEGRAEAIEDAVRLVRDLADANPRAAIAPEMRAFLSYADLVALPRIGETAAPTPEEDLAGLGLLAR